MLPRDTRPTKCSFNWLVLVEGKLSNTIHTSDLTKYSLMGFLRSQSRPQWLWLPDEMGRRVQWEEEERQGCWSFDQPSDQLITLPIDVSTHWPLLFALIFFVSSAGLTSSGVKCWRLTLQCGLLLLSVGPSSRHLLILLQIRRVNNGWRYHCRTQAPSYRVCLFG